MIGRGLRVQAAIFVAAMVAILSSGLPGALHRHAEHSPGSDADGQSHVHESQHACSHGDHEHSPAPQEQDHDHSEGACELCLMLALGGQWGPQLDDGLGLPMATPSHAAPNAVRQIGSLLLAERLARGPPTLILG